MMIETAIQIITDEKLYIRKYNWFESRKTKSGELGIIKQEDKWIIYATEEERGWLLSIKPYFFLSEALDNFIERMRAGKRIKERFLTQWSEKNANNSHDSYLRGLEIIKNDQIQQRQEWLACNDRIYSVII